MDETLLAVRVAELYFEENKTHDEIGALLGISRWKAGRLLQFARESGIVRIEIVHPRARRLGLERELRERFGLGDAIVVPEGATAGERREGAEHPAPSDDRVARAAADYLTALRPAPKLLGVSWGRTLAAVAEALPQGWAHGVTVVQINGAVTLNRRRGTAAQLAAMIAQKGGGSEILVPSPAILERLETKQAIEADRTVADVLTRATTADAYLFSAGVVDESSAHVQSGYVRPEEIALLAARGAVGDVLGRYIDADGHVVDAELDARTVGLSLEALRAARTSVFVSSGPAKHDIARAIVSAGLCTVIVTDESTARSLLEDQ